MCPKFRIVANYLQCRDCKQCLSAAAVAAASRQRHLSGVGDDGDGAGRADLPVPAHYRVASSTRPANSSDFLAFRD